MKVNKKIIAYLLKVSQKSANKMIAAVSVGPDGFYDETVDYVCHADDFDSTHAANTHDACLDITDNALNRPAFRLWLREFPLKNGYPTKKTSLHPGLMQLMTPKQKEKLADMWENDSPGINHGLRD